MDDWKLPWAGGCRCDALRFEITEPPMLASVCHCRGCQRMSASAFSTTLTVPESGFAVTAGETAIGGLHGEDIRHHHCSRCLGWVFTRTPMGFVNVRATMLDDAGWFVPFVEVQTAEKLPWAEVPAEFSYERFPSYEEWGELAAAFVERGARP